MHDRGFNWRPITLVAFDVDGTLYAQRPLRLRMAAALIAHSLMRADWRTFAVLRSYRAHRERLGDLETEDFEPALLAEVAARHGLATEDVSRAVAEWMEARPLPLLARCRYAALDTLFERIRASGRAIGVLSDYPASDKLRALGLAADHVVHAGEVGTLKPHPRGLQRLMELAGARPEQTVLIGDRAERDGAAAGRAGAQCLLRADRPVAGWTCFTRFDDPLFDGLLEARLAAAA